MLSDNVTWHGRFRGSNWGWDQACWHQYLMEQMDHKLDPAECPRLVLDFNAEVMVHLSKLATNLRWGVNGRVAEGHTGSRPCVLHAPGPAKYVLPSFEWWFDERHRRNLSEADAMAEFSRSYAPNDVPKGALHYFRMVTLPRLGQGMSY